MGERRSVRIGNQSAFSASPLTAPFDFALAHGFDSFEWFPDKRPGGPGWMARDLDSATRREIRARARDHGVTLSVHAPVHAEPLRPGADRELDESLHLAVDLGATLLNIHLSDPAQVEQYAAAVTPLLERCAVSGVRLAIENVPGTGPEDFNRLFALLPRVAGPTGPVGMCLDVGHANLYAGTHNNYLGYVDRLGPGVPIIHLHLHENWGDRDSHLVIFTGPAGRDPAGVLGLLDRLAGRGFAGSIVLEQWPDPPEMLEEARSRLLSLLGER
jgi:sugar phosphate isomerase/epimerase